MKWFFLLFFVPLIASAAADPLSDLDSLLANQRAENIRCNSFRRRWHEVVKGGLSGESPSHVSKDQAIAALKLLERFRFHGEAQAKAWRYVVENEPLLAQVPDQKAVLDRFARIESPCEVFSRAVHRQLLLKDVEALKLTKKEARSVDSEAQDFLRFEGAGTLSGLGMKIHFLTTYLDTLYDGENKPALQAKAQALLKELESGRAQMAAELKQLEAAGKGQTLAGRAPELQLWSRLNASLESTVGELGQ